MVGTIEAGFMTKDLALLVGADQAWLSTTGFLDKIDERLPAKIVAPVAAGTPSTRTVPPPLTVSCAPAWAALAGEVGRKTAMRVTTTTHVTGRSTRSDRLVLWPPVTGNCNCT